MPRIIFISVIIMSINCSCQERVVNSSKIEEKEQIAPKETAKRDYYLTGYTNMPMDTVYYDSVVTMACFAKPAIIDNKFYLAYSKSELTYADGKEIHRIYKSHYLNSYDLEYLPAKQGELFNVNRIISSDKEVELGDSYSFDADVRVKQITSFPNSDSLTYIYVILPRYSSTHTHIVLEKKDDSFIKLFDFSSSYNFIKFRMIDSSIVEFRHELFLEDYYELDTLRYNLKTREFTEN